MALMHKNVKFQWTNAYAKSFQKLKEWLVTAPILTIPKEEEGFVIYCDASCQGLGVVSCSIKE